MDVYKKDTPSLTEGVQKIDRRSFFTFFAGRVKEVVEEQRRGLRPPGAIEESRFRTLCDGCEACVTACPYGSIKLIKGGFPILIPEESPCRLCTDFPCIGACKAGALQPVGGISHVKIGTAIIDQAACIAWDDGDCRICLTVCPLPGEAIDLEDFKPVIYTERCTGCGICEQACATVNDRTAIRVKEQRAESREIESS